MAKRAICFLSALVLGSLAAAGQVDAKTLFSFEGGVDRPQGKLDLVINPGEQGSVIGITATGKGAYKMSANLNHITTPFFDISTSLEGTAEVATNEEGSTALKGKLASRYTLVNYKPVSELGVEFELAGETLIIRSMSLGTIFCQGAIQIAPPFALNLLVRWSGMDINDFLGFFTGGKTISAQGEVDGDIQIVGTFLNPRLKGKLSSYGGFVQRLDYNHITANVEGVYPIIYVADSHVAQPDGLTFKVAGKLNLEEKGTLVQQIQAFSKEPVVTDNGGNREWTLKRFQSDEQGGKTELKYLLRREGSREEEGSDMLGIERTVEF